MTMRLYESYGALGHEFRPIYSWTVPATDHYNIVSVEIPDEYPISRSVTQDLLIDLDGETYLLREVLTNFRDSPCLIWFDGKQKHRRILRKC